MAESLQDRLSYALDTFSRKLRDTRLEYSGNEFRAIKFSAAEMESDIDEEKFFFEDNINDNPTVSSREITVVISTLDEIPLSRLRRDLSVQQTTSKQSLYFYDVLPIEIRSRFDVQIEKGDIIVMKLYDERNKNIKQLTERDFPFYLTLTVTETIGKFSPKSLINMKFNVAPYTQIFPTNVIALITSF